MTAQLPIPEYKRELRVSPFDLLLGLVCATSGLWLPLLLVYALNY